MSIRFGSVKFTVWAYVDEPGKNTKSKFLIEMYCSESAWMFIFRDTLTSHASDCV